MLIPNYAPNFVFGVGGTLVYVVQNCQLLEHIPLWGYTRFFQQKYCYQGTGISDDVLQRSLHSTKCTAWVAIPKNGIIGPYPLAHIGSQTKIRAQSVNTAPYGAIWQYWGRLKLHGSPKRTKMRWTVVPASLSHPNHQTTAHPGRERFQDKERQIGKKCNVELAPHSEDLNLPDFYLCCVTRFLCIKKVANWIQQSKQ